MEHALEEDNHWWFASRTRALNALMEELLPTRSDLHLLDVGCGAGNMMHHLSRYGRVKGLEIDPRPVKKARERGYEVDLFDVTQPMPFADGSFDAVTALDVIEHNEDDLAILRDSYRV
ncbi:MAG TPA: class I SAM-dependent methyltransferase, partial [Anaerolineae bacterium]|nr:class I SAM-dependent methyltransferase [Anaerolineae bacterium]